MGITKKQTKTNEEVISEIDKMQEQIKNLALTIDKVEDEKLVIQNQLKKVFADYTNLERDMYKRIEIKENQMKSEIANKLVKALDDIHYANKAVEEIEMTGEQKKWIEGVQSIFNEIEKSLLVLGVTKIDVNKGDVFDFSIHEAVTTVPTGENNTVFDVLQPGYRLGEIVIRPARVVISKTK